MIRPAGILLGAPYIPVVDIHRDKRMALGYRSRLHPAKASAIGDRDHLRPRLRAFARQRA